MVSPQWREDPRAWRIRSSSEYGAREITKPGEFCAASHQGGTKTQPEFGLAFASLRPDVAHCENTTIFAGKDAVDLVSPTAGAKNYVCRGFSHPLRSSRKPGALPSPR